jgi:hypothetical protein
MVIHHRPNQVYRFFNDLINGLSGLLTRFHKTFKRLDQSIKDALYGLWLLLWAFFLDLLYLKCLLSFLQRAYSAYQL